MIVLPWNTDLIMRNALSNIIRLLLEICLNMTQLLAHQTYKSRLFVAVYHCFLLTVKRTILQISQFGNFHLQIVVYVEITISVLKKTNINHLISSSCVSDINLYLIPFSCLLPRKIIIWLKHWFSSWWHSVYFNCRFYIYFVIRILSIKLLYVNQYWRAVG